MNSDIETETSHAPAGCLLAVVDASPRIQNKLIEILGDKAYARAFFTIEDLVRVVGQAPLVVVMGPSMTAPPEMRNIAMLLAERPNTAVVCTVPGFSEQYMAWAANVGVADVINVRAESDQLVTAAKAAAATMSDTTQDWPTAPQARATQSQAVRPTPPQATADVIDIRTHLPSAEPRIAQRGPSQKGKIISVFSTKGGSGKSVVAANLAVSLARDSRKPVVLVDADLQFGDVAVMLKLHSQYSILDASNAIDRLDEVMLKELLASHDASGLLVLPGPISPNDARSITGEHITAILELLSNIAGHVIVDTSSHLDEVMLAVLGASHEVVMVGGVDIPSVKDVRLGIEILRNLGGVRPNIRMVINRAKSRDSLDMNEVQQGIGMKIDAEIPSDSLVPRSLNHRVPAVLDSPKASVSKAFNELAKLVQAEK